MAFKAKFAAHGKIALISAGEVAVIGTSMILSKKFLDFNTLFKNKIAADATFVNKWYMKHEGAIKFVAGVAAATFIPAKYPWLRIVALGVAAGGFIQEVRFWTTDAAGNAFFDKVGAADDSAENEEMRRIAEQYTRQIDSTSGAGIDQYGSQVAGLGIDQYGSQVAGLSESYNMSTGAWNVPMVAMTYN